MRCVEGFADSNERAFPFAVATLRSVEISGEDGLPIIGQVDCDPASKSGLQAHGLRHRKALVGTDRRLSIEVNSSVRGRSVRTWDHVNAARAEAIPAGGAFSSCTTASSLEERIIRPAPPPPSRRNFRKDPQSADIESESLDSQSGRSVLAEDPCERLPRVSVLSWVTADSYASATLLKSSMSPASLGQSVSPARSIPFNAFHSTNAQSSWEAYLAVAIHKQLSPGASPPTKIIRAHAASSVGKSHNSGLCDSQLSPQLVCKACRNSVDERPLRALGHTWHPQCFTCIHCACLLQEGDRFYTSANSIHEQGQSTTEASSGVDAHCHDCYIELSFPRCFTCLEHVIDEPAVAAAGHIFHLRCFRCSHCGLDMGIKASKDCENGADIKKYTAVRYFENGGLVYCERDFMRLFSSKCLGCSFDIFASNAQVPVNLLGGQWHRECFVCAECGKALLSEGTDEEASIGHSWRSLDGLALCIEHFSLRQELECEVLNSSDEEPVIDCGVAVKRSMECVEDIEGMAASRPARPSSSRFQSVNLPHQAYAVPTNIEASVVDVEVCSDSDDSADEMNPIVHSVIVDNSAYAHVTVRPWYTL